LVGVSWYFDTVGWLGDKMDIQPIKPVPLNHKGSLLEQAGEEKTKPRGIG